MSDKPRNTAKCGKAADRGAQAWRYRSDCIILADYNLL
jgi:hypothetical protein